MFYLRDFPNEQVFSRMRDTYPDLDPDAISCFLRVIVAGSEFLTRLDKMLAEFGLTHGRWVTLLLLRRREITQALPSELAKEQGVTRATMSGLINQLERHDLITKRNDPEDGRQTTIILTAAGSELVGQIMPSYYELIDDLFSPLGTHDKTDLKAILDKLLSIK
jgi:MarR family transcriptional regulator, negative regulator of the multidrug operon emrRAB